MILERKKRWEPLKRCHLGKKQKAITHYSFQKQAQVHVQVAGNLVIWGDGLDGLDVEVLDSVW